MARVRSAVRDISRYATGVDTELDRPQPAHHDLEVPLRQHITWKAPDGTDGRRRRSNCPTAGRRATSRCRWSSPSTAGRRRPATADLRFDPHNGRLYFAAKGYAVLCPNYRGSTGYGDKFVTDLIGHENDIEVKDILAGIQHLIKEGIADPERIAVMGWSNGGYLTNCLITLKDPPVKIKARQQRRLHRRHRRRVGLQRRAGLPDGLQEGVAVGDAGHLPQDLADLRPRQRHDADADPRRRQRPALPAGPQPDAVPGAEGVREGADGTGGLPRRAARPDEALATASRRWSGTWRGSRSI